MPTQQETHPDWPGKRLGLPATGPRSVARFGRRLVALLIDWAIATGISFLLVHEQHAWITLGAFALLQYVFIITLSGSVGHLIAGLRVVPLDPAWVGPLKPLIRTVLLCLVIPVAMWDTDQRGLHDRVARTVLVRR
jgi:uncharacterized RDD family membrane protein YckC